MVKKLLEVSYHLLQNYTNNNSFEEKMNHGFFIIIFLDVNLQ